jgi:hypothetical protein
MSASHDARHQDDRCAGHLPYEDRKLSTPKTGLTYEEGEIDFGHATLRQAIRVKRDTRNDASMDCLNTP